MINRSAFERALAAASIRSAISSAVTRRCPSKCPQRLGSCWSSIWTADAPAASSWCTARITDSGPPNPVSASTIRGSRMAARIPPDVLDQLGEGDEPQVGQPVDGVGQSGAGDVGRREPGLFHQAGGDGVGHSRHHDRPPLRARPATRRAAGSPVPRGRGRPSRAAPRCRDCRASRSNLVQRMFRRRTACRVRTRLGSSEGGGRRPGKDAESQGRRSTGAEGKGRGDEGRQPMGVVSNLSPREHVEFVRARDVEWTDFDPSGAPTRAPGQVPDQGYGERRLQRSGSSSRRIRGAARRP